VGVDNLAALAGLANRKGKGWWRSVPRIGVLAATAINRWLDQQRGALKGDDGVALVGRDMDTVRSHVPVSYALGMAGVVPFEWMAVSSEDERFVAGLVAVQAWLAGFPAFEATWLAYRRETERLLLWAVIVLQKPLFELNKHDCATYLLFLRRPIPEADWIGPRTSRAGMDWRPFQGPLGDAGVAQAVRVLASLHAHLVRVGHVRENHWRSERVLPSERPSGDEALGRRQIAAVDIAPFVAWLNHKSLGADEVRLRAAAAAIHLIRATGWRAAALVSATADHVLSEQGYAAGDEVTAALERFPEAVMVALSRHWADRGLTWDAASHPGAPLLAPPVMPNTGRARRKQDRGGATGYSVRGLHMLVSAAVARYRAEENPGFPLLAPGAFRLADVRTAR
jgi:integrase/recombinase XerC